MRLPRRLVVMVALAALTPDRLHQRGSRRRRRRRHRGHQRPRRPSGVTGRPVKIALSAPAADHGWLKAITAKARKAADELERRVRSWSRATNDAASQVSQIETLISQKPDVLVVLPYDGGALTPIAQKAMEAGIPVVNVDRLFSTPAAYRTMILGDNYGIGEAAANFIADELDCQGNVVEIQGIAGISVTEERTKGFADGIKRVQRRHQDRRQPAGRLPARQGPRR